MGIKYKKTLQTRIIPVHMPVENLDREVANVLAALFAITGTVLNHISTIF